MLIKKDRVMDHITRQYNPTQHFDEMFELLKLIAVFGNDEYSKQAMQLVQRINMEKQK
jgi:hypothetical protein